MPVYNSRGVMTSKKTNLAYSVDLVRGIDVYRVDLPGKTWDTPVSAVAPISSGWSTGGPALGVLAAFGAALWLRRRTAVRAAAQPA
jgi:hypothetical protein